MVWSRGENKPLLFSWVSAPLMMSTKSEESIHHSPISTTPKMSVGIQVFTKKPNEREKAAG